MSPVRSVVTFRIDDDLRPAMQALRARDGIGYSEQIRRGLRLFLEAKDVLNKPDRKRVGARRRS